MLKRWIEGLGRRARAIFRGIAGGLARTPRETIDPEIREIFLAELDELSATLAALVPELRRDPAQSATLQTLRRAFHTIKGSGLMAGALGIAGVCGHLERLAVLLIEKRRTATPELVDFFAQAIALLPICSRAIQAGQPLPAAMREIGVRAQRLLSQ